MTRHAIARIAATARALANGGSVRAALVGAR